MFDIPEYIIRNLEQPCPPHWWIIDTATKGGRRNDSDGECCKCHVTKEDFFKNSIVISPDEARQIKFKKDET